MSSQQSAIESEQEIGVPGVYLNYLTSISLLEKVTPFELICTLHAIGDGIIVAVMAFWCAPLIWFDSTAMGESTANKMLGRIVCYCWYLIHYTQLLLAINRFMAVNSFLHYKRVFSIRNTKIALIALCLYLSWYFVVPFFDGCQFAFNLSTWQWSFEFTTCGLVFGLYLDFYFTIVLLLAITTLDCFTAVGIYRHRMQSVNCHFNRTDIMFFVQSCTSNILFIIDLSLFFVGPLIYNRIFGKSADKFGSFLINTLFMEISHSLDGLLMVAFNRRALSRIFSPLRVLLKHHGRVSNEAHLRAYEQKANNDVELITAVPTEGEGR
ncbi:unnamed protein product [Heligmosomoides polygyrus]|uniref:7TM_GPCR_Srx domain-containing protein n=1 Tax=Heligmosomoides polygyrus TaxID=6339 RepID=A0A3P7WN22_HELPZ|nr:unnamed protein product [Heligmosomoides polygyrus]